MTEHDDQDDSIEAVADAVDATDVLAALGAVDAAGPPSDLRRRILGAVAARPRPTQNPVDPRELYRSRCETLMAVLADLDGDDWAAHADPYTWNVHGLVAHLLQIERYTAAVLGAASPWQRDEPDHLATGAAEIAVELARPPAETLDGWAQTVDVVRAHVGSAGWDPAAPAHLHGWPFTASALLVARAFEVWTHTDDVCRATGRPLVAPPAPELHTMSSFSVAALPFLMATERPGRGLGPTRIVLTGPGGGTFDVGAGDATPSLLVADVVDYCRVVARRIAPADLVAQRDGDLALLDDLLVAAGAFAV